MANTFLNDVFDDKEDRVERTVDNNDADQLSHICARRTDFLHRSLNRKFRDTLRDVVRFYSFRESIDTTVGRYLRREHPNWTITRRNGIRDYCKFAAGIFENWDCIVYNLTLGHMKEVDARNFGLRKLYNCKKRPYCEVERTQAIQPKKVPKQKAEIITPEFDEAKYRVIKNAVTNSDILGNVDYNEDQARLIAQRLENDMLKMCRRVQQN